MAGRIVEHNLTGILDASQFSKGCPGPGSQPTSRRGRGVRSGPVSREAAAPGHKLAVRMAPSVRGSRAFGLGSRAVLAAVQRWSSLSLSQAGCIWAAIIPRRRRRLSTEACRAGFRRRKSR